MKKDKESRRGDMDFLRVMAYLNGAGAFLWLIFKPENLTPGFIAGAVAVVAYLASRNEEDKEKK